MPGARRAQRTIALTLVAVGQIIAAAAHAAEPMPEIRTHQHNRVPQCVTPARLMQFLAERHRNLVPKLQTIAAHYKQHGDANRVRWDYAFFQMIVETNYLHFKNAAGRGDVSPNQNNFAGIGTTGGGVPGESFPDVSTGVLAQIQHLMAYSGEVLANPVGRRTRENQDDIAKKSKRLNRAVTFRDLARRWAVDARYGNTIEAIASRFRATYCAGKEPEPSAVVAGRAPADTVGARRPGEQRHGPVLAANTRPDPAGGSGEGTSRRSEVGLSSGHVRGPLKAPAPPPTGCRVFTASYGGEKAVLVRAVVGGEWHYTALQVLDGQETQLARHFMATHALGGDTLGEFATRDLALGRAFSLCPQLP